MIDDYGFRGGNIPNFVVSTTGTGNGSPLLYANSAGRWVPCNASPPLWEWVNSDGDKGEELKSECGLTELFGGIGGDHE